MKYEETEVRVEWDFDNVVILARQFKDNEPFVSGIERQSDNTAWLPLIKERPKDYVPGQPRLLGPEVHSLHPDGDKVISSYPEADFSPQAFRDNAKLICQERGEQVLAETDWYVIRYMEKGIEIPSDIVAARENVRIAINNDSALVDAMAVSELQDYDAVNINNAAKVLKEAVKKNRLGKA